MKVGLGQRGEYLVACSLAVLGGTLAFLGWAGFGYWPLALVALVPFWAALEIIRGRPPWAAFLIGWLYWTVAHVGGSHWMHGVVMEFSGLGPMESLLLAMGTWVYLGGQFAVVGVLYAWVRNRGWSVATAAVPTLLSVEWLYPTWFPVYLSHSLVQVPLLVQTVDLGGALLVTALLVAVNLLLFEVLRWALRLRNAPVVVALTTTSLVAAGVTYGAIRIAQVDAKVAAASTLEVGVVQANVGIEEGQKDPIDGHRKHLALSGILTAEGPVDLMVWPESSVRYPTFPRTVPLGGAQVRQRLETPLLFGGISGTQDDGAYTELYNTVFYVDGQGLMAQRYDKVRLFAFGEFVPFEQRLPLLRKLAPKAGRYDRGQGLEAFRVGPWRVSTPICYEDLLPDFVRRMVSHAGPHLLVNLTNDAWFGDSLGAYLHFRMAQFRAIEHRRYLVRATNTGVSGVIDPVGRVLIETDIDATTTFRASVAMMEGTTVYGRLGDWPGWLALAVAMFLLIRRGAEP